MTHVRQKMRIEHGTMWRWQMNHDSIIWDSAAKLKNNCVSSSAVGFNAANEENKE